MNAARPLSLARSWCVWLALAGCGEVAAPAAPPEEFDDPFAEGDVKAPAAGAVAAEPVPADRPVEAPAVPAASAGEVAAGASGGEVAAGGSAGEVVGAPVTAVAEPAAAATGPAATGPAATTAPADEKRAGKKPAGTKSDAPVPKDSPAPAPEPAPAPVPEPTPAPAPATTPTPAPVEKPAPPPVPPQQRFVGTYRFAGGDAQRQNLEAAIEAAAMELNALIRGIGRKRLKESNPIREQITIAVDGDKVSMTFGPGRTLTGRLDGPAVPWTSDSGKPVQVAISLVKGRLVQTFTAEDGGRRSVYTLDESGDRMTLSVTVTSERLTNPVKYALTYRRS